MITKYEMADTLISSPAWNGTQDIDYLLKNYSKRELEGMYDEIEGAESHMRDYCEENGCTPFDMN